MVGVGELPDRMNMIINIIIFLVVAVFLILAARMILERSEPKLVISAALIPISQLRLNWGKKGSVWADFLPWIVIAMVVFAVSFLFISGAGDGMVALVLGLGSGVLDLFAFA